MTDRRVETKPTAPALKFAAAKLNPRLSSPRPVPRTQLIDRMLSAEHAALVLVHGPAGFGKSTAMLQYYAQLRDRGVATGWLTLDRADNDLDRFLTYLIEAFRSIDPSIASVSGMRSIPPAGDAHGVTLDLVGHLASFEGRFVLFLDDFETVESPVVLGLLRQLLEYLHEGGQVVVGSRTVPDLNLGRMRAHGRLAEISTAQLRFSSVETATFLRQRRGLALRDQDIRRLQLRTEGWPAALWLVSLALHERADPHAFIDTFDGSDASIADYLVEDVLARQNTRVSDFLLRTSVLQDLSAPLCDFLLERDDSGELLVQIERAHLFLVPQDPDRHWYRFHPLFAGFLRDQLRQSDPKIAPRLHRRAAEWWLGQQQPVRAIEHALNCGDPPYVLDLLAAHAGDLVWQGRARTLARWYAAMPIRTQLEDHPQLGLSFAWALTLTHHYDDSMKLLDAMDAVRVRGGVAQVALPAVAVNVQRAFILAMTDRVRESSALWRECVPQLTPAQPFSAAMLGASYGYCLVAESRFDEARTFLDQARQRGLENGNSFIAPMALCLQGAIDFAQGRLQSARASFRAALGGGAPTLVPHAASNTIAAAFLAEALYEGNELDEAERLLSTHLPVLRDVAAPDQLISSYLTLARIAVARGRHELGADVLEDMEVAGHQHALPRMVASARLERGRIALLRAQVPSAQDQIAAGSEPHVWLPFEGLVTHANDTEAPFIAGLRLRIRSGRAESAVSPLKQALKEAERLQRHRRALKLGVLLAEAQCASGDLAAGLRRLRDAVRFAATEGFVRTFIDEGPELLRWLLELRAPLADMLDATIVVSFVDRVLGAGGIEAPSAVPQRAPAASNLPGAASILSERELQVLRLVSSGHRNRVIAERLFVSETTIKAHLRSINIKLGADNRTHALAVARQHGLVA